MNQLIGSPITNPQSITGQALITACSWPPLDGPGFVAQFFIMLELFRVPAKIAPNANYNKGGSLLKADVPYHTKTTARLRYAIIYRKLRPSAKGFDLAFSPAKATHSSHPANFLGMFCSRALPGGRGRTQRNLQVGPGSVCSPPLGAALQVVPFSPRKTPLGSEGARG